MGEQINGLGMIDVCVDYQGQKITSSVLIIKGHEAN